MRVTFRKTVLTVTAALAIPLAASLPASASAGPKVYASCATSPGGACAGYQLTGNQFRFVAGSAFVRDPSQDANVTNGLGWQVTLVGAGPGNQ